MSETKKEPASVERSLGYIAWDIKNILKEFQKMNENLEKLISQGKEF